MKRTESQQLGEIAEEKFSAIISCANFIPNKREHDYGIDFDVVVVESGEIAEFQFCVQVKLAKSYKKKPDISRIQINASHLRHYLNKQILPVFIVGIDVVRNKGYWLFAQKYVEEMSNKKLASSKGKITVQIPKSNKLEDHEGLLKAVKDAHKYMKKLHPGAVSDAIVKSEKDLKLLDDRFDYMITADRDTTKITCTARQDILVDFSFKGNQDTREKFKRMAEYGIPTTFKPDELDVKGLPVLEHKLKESGGRLKLDVGVKVKVLVEVSTEMPKGKLHRQIGSFKGHIKGGTKKSRLVCKSTSNPFALSIEMDPRTSTGTSKFLPFNGAAWLGQKLLNLPFFEELRSLYTDLKNGAVMGVRCFSDMGVLLTATAQFNAEIVEGLFAYMEVLDKARSLAQRFNINPTLKDLSFDEMIYITTLHELLTTPKFVPGLTKITLEIRKADITEAIQNITNLPDDISVRLPPMLPFLGYEVEQGIKTLSITNATRLTDITKIPGFDRMSDDELMAVDFQLSKDSVVTPEFSKTDEKPDFQ